MIDDEFGYSPDVGRYVRRYGRLYTEDGCVYEENEYTTIRGMPLGAGAHENYAEWTDEQRARVLAAAKQTYEEYKKVKEAEHFARLKLVEQAKAKLTEEEYEAIVVEAVREERGGY
jgi:hypothetical protein